MVYGAILEKGEKSYTHLRGTFERMDNFQSGYNWLITDCECYSMSDDISRLAVDKYTFMSGERLTEMVFREDFKWVWAVLSGFSKDIPLERILEHPLPFADGYGGFWKNPLTIQHPLAEIEIVAWDAGLTLFFSREKSLADSFRKAYPLSEDLAESNKK